MMEQKERTEKLKAFLDRLNKGEELERVREDFVKEFSQVDATEIMEAEQQMLSEGTPLEEVQKLCDVHAALFRAAAPDAEEAADPSLLRKQRAEKTRELTETTGHPLSAFHRENQALEKLIEKAKTWKEEKDIDRGALEALQKIAGHYARKGDLLYPVLKVGYGVSGPSDVMWTTDDEIRDALSSLLKRKDRGREWFAEFGDVMNRAEDMIYKEENILFPNCASYFTKEEWMGIYHDAKDYPGCFGVEPEKWEEAEKQDRKGTEEAADGRIKMQGGEMTVKQLSALLNTLPFEVTFVDEQGKNRYFNEGHKVFKRPAMALGREVYSCHPPKIEKMVKRIIGEFKAGTMDEVPVWMEKNGRTMLVKYMAVRDREGNYLGTLELVQDMEFAKEHFNSR